jgi:ribonuclease D
VSARQHAKQARVCTYGCSTGRALVAKVEVKSTQHMMQHQACHNFSKHMPQHQSAVTETESYCSMQRHTSLVATHAVHTAQTSTISKFEKFQVRTWGTFPAFFNHLNTGGSAQPLAATSMRTARSLLSTLGKFSGRPPPVMCASAFKALAFSSGMIALTCVVMHIV